MLEPPPSNTEHMSLLHRARVLSHWTLYKAYAPKVVLALVVGYLWRKLTVKAMGLTRMQSFLTLVAPYLYHISAPVPVLKVKGRPTYVPFFGHILQVPELLHDLCTLSLSGAKDTDWTTHETSLVGTGRIVWAYDEVDRKHILRDNFLG